MAKVKLKHNGDGTYKALLIEDKYQILYDRVIMSIKILQDNDGKYGIMDTDINKDISHTDEWDWEFETNRLIWK